MSKKRELDWYADESCSPESNTKVFKGFEELVGKWKEKHSMALIMPEFQSLFKDIEKQAKKK